MKIDGMISGISIFGGDRVLYPDNIAEDIWPGAARSAIHAPM
jgi:hypothetical protein